MNIKQAKEQIKNAMTAYFTKDEFGNYVIPIEKQRPIFLMGDVHILGFGMDPAEFELWWLACCKQRNFPDSKTFFYTRGVDPEQALLMRAYGIEIIPCEAENYPDFYRIALDEIRKRMG